MYSNCIIFMWVVTINWLYALKTKFRIKNKSIDLSTKTTKLIKARINLKKALRIGID